MHITTLHTTEGWNHPWESSHNLGRHPLMQRHAVNVKQTELSIGHTQKQELVEKIWQHVGTKEEYFQNKVGI